MFDDVVMFNDGEVETEAFSLKEGDILTFNDADTDTMSQISVNEVRFSEDGEDTVIEGTVLNSNAFEAGDNLLFSAESNEILDVDGNLYGDVEDLNYASGPYWLVVISKDGSRRKLGPFDEDQVKAQKAAIQNTGMKVKSFKSESEADKSASGKLTNKQKAVIASAITATALAGGAAVAGHYGLGPLGKPMGALENKILDKRISSLSKKDKDAVVEAKLAKLQAKKELVGARHANATGAKGTLLTGRGSKDSIESAVSGLKSAAAALKEVKKSAKEAKDVSHSANEIYANEIEVNDVVHCDFGDNSTDVLIMDGWYNDDGSIHFSGMACDDNMVERKSIIDFDTIGEAVFSLVDVYDEESQAMFSSLVADEYDNYTESNFSDGLSVEDKLNLIEAEGGVAKTLDEVAPGDVARVDGETDVLITEVIPSDGGAKVVGKVVSDDTGNFSDMSDVAWFAPEDELFSIVDLYDPESDTFFSTNFAMDCTPTETPQVEITEKVQQPRPVAAPVDMTYAPVTRKLGEPAPANFSMGFGSEDSIEDKLNYLKSED